MSLNGIFAPVFTPVDDAGHVNIDVIPEYAQYLHAHNVPGVLVGGTTGEAALLNLAERKTLLEAWVGATRPLGMKVISQVGGGPLPDVIELARFSKEVQADAIMTLPELYYKPRTVEQLVSNLEIVANAAPSLPLIYYHFPMMSGVDMNMKQFFATAKARIPSFKGMKADLGVAVQIADELNDDQVIFMANHHLATSALMGYESSIATVTNVFPDLVHGILDAVRSRDVMLARQRQAEMNKIVETIASYGDFVPAMKVAMELVSGIKVGSPRRPLTPLEKTMTIRMRDQLRSLGVNTVA